MGAGTSNGASGGKASSPAACSRCTRRAGYAAPLNMPVTGARTGAVPPPEARGMPNERDLVRGRVRVRVVVTVRVTVRVRVKVRVGVRARVGVRVRFGARASARVGARATTKPRRWNSRRP